MKQTTFYQKEPFEIEKNSKEDTMKQFGLSKLDPYKIQWTLSEGLM